jgi:hypothetical protein
MFKDLFPKDWQLTEHQSYELYMSARDHYTMAFKFVAQNKGDIRRWRTHADFGSLKNMFMDENRDKKIPTIQERHRTHTEEQIRRVLNTVRPSIRWINLFLGNNDGEAKPSIGANSSSPNVRVGWMWHRKVWTPIYKPWLNSNTLGAGDKFILNAEPIRTKTEYKMWRVVVGDLKKGGELDMVVGHSERHNIWHLGKTEESTNQFLTSKCVDAVSQKYRKETDDE